MWKKESYKMWQMVAAFVVGVALTVTATYVGNAAMEGSIFRMKSATQYAGSYTDLGYEKGTEKGVCGDLCTIERKIDELTRLFKSYTGAMDGMTSFTSSWTGYTASVKRAFERLGVSMK